MPGKKLLCIVCGQMATHRTEDGAPLCEAHAVLYADARPMDDPAATVPDRIPTAMPAVIPLAEPEAEPDAETVAQAEVLDVARRMSRELLAIVLSVAIAIVGGAIGGGIFYAVVGYFRGGEEALGGAYESAAGVAAIVVAVVVFLVARKSLSQRFKRKS